MKTTLNLDDRLLRSAKKAAAERGVTLTQVIEEALAAALTMKDPKHLTEFRWKVIHGRRRPDLDIADRNALYDFMESQN